MLVKEVEIATSSRHSLANIVYKKLRSYSIIVQTINIKNKIAKWVITKISSSYYWRKQEKPQTARIIDIKI